MIELKLNYAGVACGWSAECREVGTANSRRKLQPDGWSHEDKKCAFENL